MADLILSSIIYFLLVGISLLGFIFSGLFIMKKTGEKKVFSVPEPTARYMVIIWLFNYAVSIFIEFSGNIIGFWTWGDTIGIFLHAGVFWASMFAISFLILGELKVSIRYVLFTGWVLFFEFLQPTLVQWWYYYPLLGNQYLMITIIMCVFGILNFCPFIYYGFKLLKKEE